MIKFKKRKNGADLVLGGHKLDREGFFYAPIFRSCKTTDSAFKEEILIMFLL